MPNMKKATSDKWQKEVVDSIQNSNLPTPSLEPLETPEFIQRHLDEVKAGIEGELPTNLQRPTLLNRIEEILATYPEFNNYHEFKTWATTQILDEFRSLVPPEKKLSKQDNIHLDNQKVGFNQCRSEIIGKIGE